MWRRLGCSRDAISAGLWRIGSRLQEVISSQVAMLCVATGLPSFPYFGRREAVEERRFVRWVDQHFCHPEAREARSRCHVKDD
ncbi:hypothetical protein IE81DRAFT_145245 [Ceraceosorus guamensis]|uniref:Uncharacterized protein n=1 Tax=Ceraceosorus guamensis TaxID=1522189 RepID=A0A316VWK6_9BASI|nr:hypothetical protein IE81DRAFT_145245 [Ceraceosorus guamensis]PWN42027.1 hypothetical protein IE81DRAFT_145245 [Ceraceosorus guamensis]